MSKIRSIARRHLPKMREFIFTGEVTLRGVQFFVMAADEDEAKEKARAGEYVEYEAGAAETSDWEIDPNSCEGN